MLISTYTGDKEVRIQTVSLRKNEEHPTNTFMFYCIFCGGYVSRVQGDIDKITPGLEPTSQVVVITTCSDCRKEYTFQTVNNKPRVTRLTLTNYTDTVSTLHCHVCRTPLVQFKAGNAVSLPLFTAISLPFPMKCFRPTCPANFQIVEIVG